MEDFAGSSARHGKIARLPRKFRDELNRRLDEGWAGPALLQWLNGLPETKRLIKEQFNGQAISQQNLSQWRLGGYRDWLLNQEAREAVEDFVADSRGLEGKMGFEFADKLALWLCMRFAVMTRHLERMDPLESWRPLRQMCRDVVALRRGDAKLREQRLKEEQQKELTEEAYRKWVSAPGRIERLYYEKTGDEKVKRKIEKQRQDKLDQIFGMTPKPDPDEEDQAEGGQREAASQLAAVGPAKETNPDKVEQSKTKCVSAVTPPSPETPNTGLRSEDSARQAKHQTPITGSSPEAPVGQVGPAGQTEVTTAAVREPPGTPPAGAASSTAAPPLEAVPAPASGPGITFRKREQRFINQCFCGAKNQIPLSECLICKMRLDLHLEPCECH